MWALLSPAVFAVVNILDDNLLRGAYENPFFATIISGLIALLPVLSVLFLDISIPSLSIVLLALLAGFLLVTSYFFYFKAMLVDVPSVTIALWNLSPALVPFLAFFFLGEVLSFFQYIGFILVLGASIVLSLLSIRRFRLSRAFYFMIAASALTAVVAIMAKYIYGFVSFWDGFIFVSLGMGVGGLFFLLCFKKVTPYQKISSSC